MRKILAATVALGPLCLACAAFADTTITSSTSNALKTSTAGNITINAGGSVNVKTGEAVTVDSSNSVSNAGSITMNVAGNSTTGLKLIAGNTGEITNSGTIDLEDGYSRPDANKDGLPDGPWATGTDRRGLWLTGPGAFTGNITNSGGITVKGESSYGVALDSVLTGNFASTGTITVTGDNSYGFRSTAAINGVAPVSGTAEALHIGGSVSVTGNASQGIDVEGDVTGGRVTFDGSVTVTGFSSTNRFVGTVFNKLDPSDLAQSGPAVTLAGNLSNGALFDATPTGNISATTDLDGDGVADTTQKTSAITVFGSAPALQIGSAAQTNDITLGAVGTGNATAAADYNYGLIVKGSIAADGVWDRYTPTSGPQQQFSAVAVQIGAGGGNVTIAGGIRNTGNITAQAFQSHATGIELKSGAEADTIRNEGVIKAQTVGANPGDDAVAILIGSGATTHTITNSGAINATVTGETNVSVIGNPTAIRDVSGTLTDIENRGSIVAMDDSGIPADEDLRTTAVDASNNTTGVTIHQYQLATSDPTPGMLGSIYLGTGADTLDVTAGTVTAPILNFGSGADQLIVNGPIAGGNITTTTSVIGAIYQGDGQLAIDVASGYLQQNNSHTLGIKDLHVGTTGTLVVTVDPSGGTPTGGFVVSGNAVFDNNSSLGIHFAHVVHGIATQQFVLVDASGGTLTVNGAINTSTLQANTPYLYEAAFDPSQIAAKKIVVDITPRTAQQLGMNGAEAQAYHPFLDALTNTTGDTNIESAFLAQTTKDGFFKLYDQLMPIDAAAPLLSLASGVDEVSRAMTDRRPVAEPGETTGWAQEIDFYANKKEHDSPGFSSFGFGIASGMERGTALGALGVSFAFTSSNLNAPATVNNDNNTANLLELGLYWRASTEHWRAWLRGAGGYAWFDSRRSFNGTAQILTARSKWSGYSAALAGGVSFQETFGRFFIRPEANIEYFYLNQGSHKEAGASETCGSGNATISCDSFDLGFERSSAEMATAVVMLNMGAKFGQDGWLQPEIHIGYRDNFLFDTGNGSAYFVQNPGELFALTSDSLKGGGAVIGFRIMATGPGGFLALEGDTDLLKYYKRYQILIRAGYRF